MATQTAFAKALLFLSSVLLAQAALAQTTGKQSCAAVSQKTCDTAHALSKGINMGNMLEAPNEGDWGLRLLPEYIPIVSQKFKTVRIPVRWSNHAAATSDAKIDETFAQRVEQAVDAFLAQGVYVILNVHHYHQLDGAKLDANEFSVAPEVVDARFLNIWAQLAQRYAKKSDKLVFEIYNEPVPKGEPWNDLAAKALRVIRKTNPERTVMFGPIGNNPVNLKSLVLPADKNLIVPFHSYIPFPFTHQGISYMPQFPKGVTCCSAQQQQQIRDQFDVVTQWSTQSGYPVHIGEFGSVKVADPASRIAYTSFVRRLAEQRGYGWTYWEFGAVFQVYDPKTKTWNQPLLDSMLNSD